MNSYLKFLSRNKLYTAIEAVGLAVSLAFVILIGSYVVQQYEVAHESPQWKRTFALGSDDFLGLTYWDKEELELNIPEVEAATHMAMLWQPVIQSGEQVIPATGLEGDADFFKVFPEYRLLEGSLADFVGKDDILVSESLARKIADQVGNDVTPGVTSSVTPGVTGSLSHVPQDTTFSFTSQSLSDYAAMKQELYHLGTRGYGIDILCENIFVKDDVLFLLISLKNGSAVSYELSAPRFAVESRRHTKRGLQYEKAVFPKQSYGLGVVQPDSVGKLVFTFDKIALVKGQVFRVYFYEKGGARNLVVTMNGKDVNGARRL